MRLLTRICVIVGLTVAGPVSAQDTGSPHYGRVTAMGGSTFHIQLPGLRPNRSGELFDVPAPILSVIGRRGDYQVRANGGDAAIAVLQAFVPTLCDLMLRAVAEVTYRARGNRRIAEVSCR